MSHKANEPAQQPPRLRLAIAITLAAAVVATAVGLAVRAHDYRQLVTWTDAQELPTVQLVVPLTSADAHHMTLPGHIESGEELFLVSRTSDGAVWYEIRAFSRPRHWLARLGYPLVRWLQARFRRDSARQMQAFVNRTAAV